MHVNRICQTSTASIAEVEKTEFHLQLDDLTAPLHCLQHQPNEVLAVAALEVCVCRYTFAHVYVFLG
jgi:hypothetical protein